MKNIYNVSMIYIYGLYDPETLELRYIGKSIHPKERLTNHMNDQSITWRTNWLKGLKKKNMKPMLYIFEKHQDVEWQELEIKYIALARQKGIRLTNCTDGGDGVVNVTGPGKERMLATWTGRKHKPESLIKIGAASSKRRHSEEWKKAQSERMKGRKITWADKVGKANLKLSDKQIREIRELLNKKVSQYVIADMYGVHQGTISNINRGKCYQHVS